ncbi:MAG: glycosyltransferase family 4 protein [Nitrososphaerota archaeon]|nr:glycosyltransferase family 4 protein [Nitrososphaerota archaeon]
MKITFVLPPYSSKPVGGFIVVYEYANQLVTRGHECTVVHGGSLLRSKSHSFTNLYRRLTAKVRKSTELVSNQELHWYPLDSRVKMLCVPETKASYIPDGDVIFGNLYADVDCPPEKGKKVFLLQGYGVWPELEGHEDALWRMPVDKIVIAKWLHYKGLEIGVPENEITYIPNGIDHKKYRILQPIENRPQRIAMLYHLLFFKGAKEGIEALELARKEFPSLQAVLFGILPKPNKLPSWIEYRYDPPQEELVNNIYNGSSIYLCPSWNEGFGLPPAEAVACGCAVVSTDNGGVRDYAEHEVTALLSPPKNPEALAQNIIRLLEDDALRIRLAKSGRKRITEFTWERSTDLLEQFLRNVMQRPGLQRK